MIELDISPILFTIGPIEVRWYGLMVSLGILAVVLWLFFQVKRGAKISADTVFTIALVGIPSGIIFSRLLHVVDEWERYSQDLPSIIGGQGLTIYGAILGAALGIWIYSKFSKFSFSYFGDLVVPGLILGQAIGRVGCLFNGCCYGDVTTLPWGITYTDPRSLISTDLYGMAVHPTQVYEIFFLMIVFGLLVPLRHKIKPQGSLFLIYLSIYSAWRIGMDFWRDGTEFMFGLHQSQIIGIVVMAVCLTLLVIKRREKQPLVETAEAAIENPN